MRMNSARVIQRDPLEAVFKEETDIARCIFEARETLLLVKAAIEGVCRHEQAETDDEVTLLMAAELLDCQAKLLKDLPNRIEDLTARTKPATN